VENPPSSAETMIQAEGGKLTFVSRRKRRCDDGEESKGKESSEDGSSKSKNESGSESEESMERRKEEKKSAKKLKKKVKKEVRSDEELLGWSKAITANLEVSFGLASLVLQLTFFCSSLRSSPPLAEEGCQEDKEEGKEGSKKGCQEKEEEGCR